MAIRIPQYQEQQSPNAAVPDATASADAFGAGIGRAIGGLGDTLAKAGEVYQADQDRLAKFNARKAEYEFNEKETELFETARREGRPDGGDFVKSYMPEFDKRSKEFLQSVPGRLKPEYEMRVAALRSKYSGSALSHELSTRDNYYVSELKTRTDGLASRVLANPDDYDAAVADATEFLDMAGLSPATKHKQSGAITDSLAAARIQGLRNAGRAQEANDFEIQLDERERQRQQSLPGRGARLAPTDSQAITESAGRLGIAPRDLAAVISYETGGTFSTSKFGGKGGNYMGLIQFGPSERVKYGARPDQSIPEQMQAVEAYLIDRGLKPGMGLAEIYTIINAGSLKDGQVRWNASDGNGTIRDHVARIEAQHYGNADRAIGGGGQRFAQADTGTATDASSSNARGGPQADINDLNTDLPVGRWQAYGQETQFKVDDARAKALRAATAEEERQRRLAAQEQKERSDAREMEIVKDTFSDKPTITLQDITHDPDLTREGMERVLKIVEQQNAREKNRLAGQSDTREVEILRDLFSETPTITTQQVAGDPSLTREAKERVLGIVERRGKEGSANKSDIRETEILQDLYSDRPTVTLQQVTQDARLTREAKERVLKLVEHRQTAAAKIGPTESESQEATRRMMADIRRPDGDPAKITDNQPIYDAFIQGKIRRADLDWLVQTVQNIRTPEGDNLEKRKAAFLKGVEPQIDKSNPLLGELDPSGRQQMYSFSWDLDQRIAQYRKDGKNPYDLFDPSKPDFMGKPEVLSPYQKTLQQSVGDVTRRMNPPPGAGSKVPGAAPTIVPRKAGESIEDYLKRRGIQ